MAIEVKVPDLGDGIDSGDVLNILIAEGDTIEAEQGIVELETDKAVAEIPSSHAGRVATIHVQVGQTVAIGESLITLEPTGEPASAPPSAKPADDQGSETPETTVGEDPPPPPAKQPPQAEPPAADPPQAKPLPVVENRKLPDKPTPTVASTTAEELGHHAAASPAVRRYARELGVDINQVVSSEPDGRITQDDVRRAVRKATQPGAAPAVAPTDVAAAAAKKAAPATPATPKGEAGEDAWGPVITDRITKIRATIAANMLQSKATAPHVTNFDDADITALEQVRQASKEDYASVGIKFTTMPFVIKAVGLALGHHPVINASLDLEAGQIIYKQYVHVGIAVDTERGLMVPVIRDANILGIPQIAHQLPELAEKARSGKIGLNEMRGGTFTISNLGAIGGTYSTPVINVPEVAILLVGRSRKMPVVRDDEIQIRLMMPLSLSYDHRLVDGAAAARFLNDVKGYLEAPGRLLLAP